MSELQNISRIKTWIVYYNLQSLSNWWLNKLGMTSKETYALNHERDHITKQLKKSIEADYQKFKLKTLEMRQKKQVARKGIKKDY